MPFICRVIPDSDAEEPEEIIPEVLIDETIGDIQWHLVSFKVHHNNAMGEKELGARSLRWIRGEMKDHYSMIGFVKDDKYTFWRVNGSGSLADLRPKRNGGSTRVLKPSRVTNPSKKIISEDK